MVDAWSMVVCRSHNGPCWSSMLPAPNPFLRLHPDVASDYQNCLNLDDDDDDGDRRDHEADVQPVRLACVGLAMRLASRCMRSTSSVHTGASFGSPCGSNCQQTQTVPRS